MDFMRPISTGSRMQDVSVNQLADVFLNDKLLEGGAVQGPMREANHDSFQYLTPEDITAIHSYLVTVKSKTPPKPKTGSGMAAGQTDLRAVSVQACHATGVGGAPKFGDGAAWAPLVKQGMDTLYQNAIHGIGAMPPKGTCPTCSDDDIKNTVQYMVTQSTGAHAAVAPPPQPPKQLTLADGKQIYEQYCQACHNGAYRARRKLGDKTAWQPCIAKGMDVLILNTIKGIGNMPANRQLRKM